MRLFIAINFNEEIKKELSNNINFLKTNSIKGNYTNIDNLHLTLVFLGEVEEERLSLIKNIIDGLEASSGLINIGNYDSFRKGLIYREAKDNGGLVKIYNYLYTKLKEKGFNIEDREFRSHITLGREVIFKRDFYFEYAKVKPLEFRYDSISLMLSTRENGKLVYKELYLKKL